MGRDDVGGDVGFGALSVSFEETSGVDTDVGALLGVGEASVGARVGSMTLVGGELGSEETGVDSFSFFPTSSMFVSPGPSQKRRASVLDVRKAPMEIPRRISMRIAQRVFDLPSVFPGVLVTNSSTSSISRYIGGIGMVETQSILCQVDFKIAMLRMALSLGACGAIFNTTTIPLEYLPVYMLYPVDVEYE